MSDCSTQAMAPKAQPRTCRTCGWFALEPDKRRGGACMGSYDIETCTYHATNIYRCEDDSPWCPGWRQKGPDPLEQVVREMYSSMFRSFSTKKPIRMEEMYAAIIDLDVLGGGCR